MMNLLGFNVGHGRPPMDTVPEDLVEKAQSIVSATIVGSQMGFA